MNGLAALLRPRPLGPQPGDLDCAPPPRWPDATVFGPPAPEGLRPRHGGLRVTCPCGAQQAAGTGACWACGLTVSD